MYRIKNFVQIKVTMLVTIYKKKMLFLFEGMLKACAVSFTLEHNLKSNFSWGPYAACIDQIKGLAFGPPPQLFRKNKSEHDIPNYTSGFH